MGFVFSRVRVIWWLPFLLVISFVSSAAAQGLFGVGLPSLPSLVRASCETEPYSMVVSPDIKVGYGQIGINFNFPSTLVGANIDLSFRDAGVWIGAVGARLDSRSGLFLALRGQGSASRTIGIQTPEDPFGATRWDGSKLQWWELEGSIGYRVRPWWSALVGLRRDQLSVGLTNPRADGVPLDFAISLPPVYFSERFFGDFSSRIWIPYFGLEITGQQYRASLLYGPFAWADIQIPTVLFQSLFVDIESFSLLTQVGENLQYKVRKPTQFFEYNFQYNIEMGPNFAFQVWTTGNWMQLRGTADLDAFASVVLAVGGVTVLNPSASVSESNTATYTRSMISGGIGVVANF